MSAGFRSPPLTLRKLLPPRQAFAFAIFDVRPVGVDGGGCLALKVYAAVEQKNQILRDEMLRLCFRGHRTPAALKAIGRGPHWYAKQRKEHPQWALELSRAGGRVWSSREAAEARSLEADRSPEAIAKVEFPYFCRRYLGQRLFKHQLQWWDMLEGRPPRELHPSMVYEPHDPTCLLINTPPNHVPPPGGGAPV